MDTMYTARLGRGMLTENGDEPPDDALAAVRNAERAWLANPKCIQNALAHPSPTRTVRVDSAWFGDFMEEMESLSVALPLSLLAPGVPLQLAGLAEDELTQFAANGGGDGRERPPVGPVVPTVVVDVGHSSQALQPGEAQQDCYVYLSEMGIEAAMVALPEAVADRLRRQAANRAGVSASFIGTVGPVNDEHVRMHADFLQKAMKEEEEGRHEELCKQEDLPCATWMMDEFHKQVEAAKVIQRAFCKFRQRCIEAGHWPSDSRPKKSTLPRFMQDTLEAIAAGPAGRSGQRALESKKFKEARARRWAGWTPEPTTQSKGGWRQPLPASNAQNGPLRHRSISGASPSSRTDAGSQPPARINSMVSRSNNNSNAVPAVSVRLATTSSPGGAPTAADSCLHDRVNLIGDVGRAARPHVWSNAGSGCQPLQYPTSLKAMTFENGHILQSSSSSGLDHNMYSPNLAADTGSKGSLNQNVPALEIKRLSAGSSIRRLRVGSMDGAKGTRDPPAACQDSALLKPSTLSSPRIVSFRMPRNDPAASSPTSPWCPLELLNAQYMIRDHMRGSVDTTSLQKNFSRHSCGGGASARLATHARHDSFELPACSSQGPRSSGGSAGFFPQLPPSHKVAAFRRMAKSNVAVGVPQAPQVPSRPMFTIPADMP